MSKAEQAYVLPVPAAAEYVYGGGRRTRVSAFSATLALLTLVASAALFAHQAHLLPALVSGQHALEDLASFYHSVKTHDGLCVGGVSHSGYVGLNGDSEEAPKRSFFWFFEAQRDAENAPVILTIGGGPGTSGMVNPLFGQSHCKVSSNITSYANHDAWSEHHNLLALDHPVGVGYSYGQMVNNSRDAAYDAYDFLLKFFHLYPHLAKNQFVIAGGSYGGIYVPHIATVIHEKNAALAAGRGRPGARHINLESMMVSNPMSDWLSHNRWALQQRCYLTDFYNASACADAFAKLPACLEATQMAFMDDTVERRAAALHECYAVYPAIEGRDMQNVELKCNGTIEDCYPEAVYADKFMNLASTKETLGVPQELNFTFSRVAVWQEFFSTADMAQQAYLLYEPLLKAGYRLLHYIGKLDANCAWPGVLSTLRLLPSPYQSAFNDAPDLPWPGHAATVRAVALTTDNEGRQGAGAFTFILMDHAGHFVTHDQPTLVKDIVRHWIANVGWNETLDG
ncbi:carboxypeptidase [Phanerochaete sordida]|uniref:carboxypeptidase C n=1 Tax=Phanerochaete sordida TaxID=48140 RepID=A0A9P3GGV3_9APHY|nr:carboxypeptidase [Phanerochaete sordida]